MAPDVHRDPERLRGHAAAVHELADALFAALRAPARPPAFTGPHAEELADLDAGVRRAVRELGELGAQLAAAAAVAAADEDGAAILRRAGEPS